MKSIGPGMIKHILSIRVTAETSVQEGIDRDKLSLEISM
jgi:hypothetical protein